MAGSTGGVVRFRPTIRGPRGSGAVVYLAHRQVAGIYVASLISSESSVKKNKKPNSLHPIGYVNGDKDKPVLIDVAWSKYLGLELNGRKLGGSAYPTLPDVAQFVTQQQVDAQLSAAQDQWTASLAQTLASLLQVVQTAALAGAAQVPPVVLARQETNPVPASPLLSGSGVEGGGGGGD